MLSILLTDGNDICRWVRHNSGGQVRRSHKHDLRFEPRPRIGVAMRPCDGILPSISRLDRTPADRRPSSRDGASSPDSDVLCRLYRRCPHRPQTSRSEQVSDCSCQIFISALSRYKFLWNSFFCFRFVGNNGTKVGCVERDSFCSSSPCRNGGTCSDSWGTFICQCEEGWSGHDCSQSESTAFLRWKSLDFTTNLMG